MSRGREKRFVTLEARDQQFRLGPVAAPLHNAPGQADFPR